MSQLLFFYCGTHPDHRGRTLSEILKQDDDWMEITHDYIQWLFPLPDLSRASAHAPLLDQDTIDCFKADDQLRNHMRASLSRMLRFFGLKISYQGIAKADNWDARKVAWFVESTHNSLRLSRMLRSLQLLGFAWEAHTLHAFLESLCTTEPNCGIDDTSRRFWKEAVALS